MTTTRIASLFLFLATGLLAQEPAAPAAPPAPQQPPQAQQPQRQNWARRVEHRADHSIFSALDLPAPNGMRLGSGAPGPEYWQQQADYVIDVALEPEARTVRGRETVTYHNNSPHTLEYVWVHLEQNCLRPDSISTLTDGGSLMGGDSDTTDGVALHKVAANGSRLDYSVYDTMMRIDLPEALQPGKQFVFEVEWSFVVPERVFRRYGTMQTKKGIIWELAQWFPAVAVYDDVHGWNTLPYIGGGEFYTNFGTYQLNITVPRDHVVVASGELLNPQDVFTSEQQQRFARAKASEETVAIVAKDEVGTAASRPAGEGPLTWRFRAEKVRTVAWAASPAFILDGAVIDANAASKVLCMSAYPEECAGAWSKSTQMLRKSLAGYSRRWFEYPYPVMTNVAGVEGGMEYPMILFCAAGNNERALWGVTTHEAGHTWFPMIVNTDERRHAWMDEGFNTFINGYSDEDWYGPQQEQAPRPGRRARSGGGMRMPGSDGLPIDTPADQLPAMAIGMLQYGKTGQGMRLLREHILGPERFDHAFRTYIRRWAYKSPRPADFYRTMEDAAGADLAWFWRGWFVESTRLDQAVDAVTQATDSRSARITFTNLDRMVMPLQYRITYEDDTTEDVKLPVQVWHSSNRVVRSAGAKKKVKQVVIDADGVFPDSARANNEWVAEKQ